MNEIRGRLIHSAPHARNTLLVSITAGGFAGILLVAQAYFIADIINKAFLQSAKIDSLTQSIIFVGFLILARAALTGVNTAFAGRAAGEVKSALRAKLTEKMIAFQPLDLAEERSGEIAHTLTEGVESLDAFIAGYLPKLALAALVPLAILSAVFPSDPISGAVLLFTGPLIPLFMILIGGLAGQMARRRYGMMSRMSAHFLDMLQGLTRLKLFNRSRDQVRMIRLVSEKYRDITLEVLRIAFLSAFVLELAGTISTAMIAVEIGIRLLYGRMLFQNALFILILAPEFYLPLRALSVSWHASTNGTAAAERIFTLLDQVNSLPPRGNVTAPLKIEMIGFNQVSYAYPQKDGDALKEITFTLEPGTITALVGPSGAGKSTIANLLLGFIAPDRGAITSGAENIFSFTRDSWLARIAYVPQKTYLFSGSVTDNIRLGRDQADCSAVIAAAQLAQADDFIRRLPEGYDTLLGERGLSLSGGQRQRIALARAFLKDTPILIFDEPTANIDADYEQKLQTAFERLLKGKTTLIIAHRLSTIRQADRIIVLDQGRIVESGSHDELLRSGSAYRRMLTLYQGGIL